LIGFILALISLISGFLPTAGWPAWIHVVTWVIWGAGLILSFIGIFKHPKGFAIAGLIISLFDIILFCVIIMISALSGLFFPDSTFW
jgi:hypothetical protein